MYYKTSMPETIFNVNYVSKHTLGIFAFRYIFVQYFVFIRIELRADRIGQPFAI